MKRQTWLAGALACGMVLLLARPGWGQEAQADSSLKWIPADAAGYSAILHLREQVEAIGKSNAWARLTKLPLVHMGLQKLDEEWNKEDGPLAGLKRWHQESDNRQLVKFLWEMLGDEVFVYTTQSSVEFLALLQDINTANQFAPLMMLMKGNAQALNRPQAQIQMLLQTVSENADRFKTPDLVVGFKVKNLKAARAQLKRLEKTWKDLSKDAPELKNRLKKSKINGADFLVLHLDGKMIPWEQIPLQALEENPGDLNKLVDKLKELKATVSLGLKENYLLLGIGETPRALEALGNGPRLIDRPELKPLEKFAERRLTGLSYTSKEAHAVSTFGKQDLESSFKWAQDLLKRSGLDADLKARIRKDLKALSKDLAKFMPEPGAQLSVSFSTDQGQETFAYDRTKDPSLDSSKPLTLLNHVGSKPLLVYVARSKGDRESYQMLVKWIKIVNGYVDDLAVPLLPGEIKEKYEDFMKKARPIFGRLDRATGKMLLPALADGQGGFVLDAKLKSKQWHSFMPPSDKPLPLPEPAIVVGVSDAPLLKKAFHEYRGAINDLINLVGQYVPGGFPGGAQIPEPETKSVTGGDLYYYTLPPVLGLDEQIVPTAGLSKHVGVLTISHNHAARLLAKHSLSSEGSLLAKADRPLASAVYLDWAGLMGTASAWLNYGLKVADVDAGIREQVDDVMQILQVLRNVSSVTYLEDGVVVTHTRTIVRDLER